MRKSTQRPYTGVYPYASLDLNARVSAWALAGVGSGVLTLKPEGDKPMPTDISMRMGAVGVKRPMISDLRDVAAIEHDADLVVFIYRDEVYHERSNDRGKAELTIAKQHHGPLGSVDLTFSGRFARFADLPALQVVPGDGSSSIPPALDP